MFNGKVSIDSSHTAVAAAVATQYSMLLFSNGIIFPISGPPVTTKIGEFNHSLSRHQISTESTLYGERERDRDRQMSLSFSQIINKCAPFPVGPAAFNGNWSIPAIRFWLPFSTRSAYEKCDAGCGMCDKTTDISF